MKIGFEGVLKGPRKGETSWGVGVPILEIFSQGESKEDALASIKSAIEEAIDQKGFKIEVHLTGDDTFAITAKDFNVLLGFMLKQKRMAKDLTYREVSERLDSKSPNAFRRYEQGESGTTLEKLAELVGAVSEEDFLLLKTG